MEKALPHADPGNLHVTSILRRFRAASSLPYKALPILEGSCHVTMSLAKLRVPSVNISRYLRVLSNVPKFALCILIAFIVKECEVGVIVLSLWLGSRVRTQVAGQ